MPVDYLHVDAIAAAVADIYAEAEHALLAAITRQLATGGFDDASATAWQVRKLAEARALHRTAQLLVDELERDGNVAIRQAVADGWRSGNTTALTDLTEQHIGDIGPGARAADQTPGRAIQALADATVAELRPVHAAVLRSGDDAYRRAVAGGTARKLTGARDLRRAVQDTWAGLTRRGITGFVDSSGRRWSLSSYAEMAVRTAVARSAIIGEVDAMTANGIDMCYVVDNPRECPICAKWENRVLALTEPVRAPAIATLAEAQAAGLHHPNCRHSIRPYQPSVRIVPARKPEGPEGYEAEQRQRELERGLRAWRIRYATALDDPGRQYAARRIAGWSQRLYEHLDAHPRLTRLTYREHPGAGFVAPRSSRTRQDAAYLASRA